MSQGPTSRSKRVTVWIDANGSPSTWSVEWFVGGESSEILVGGSEPWDSPEEAFAQAVIAKRRQGSLF